MELRDTHSEEILRLSLWASAGLAIVSLLCGYVLLPLAARGSSIAAGVASQARPVFDGLSLLATCVGLALLVWQRRQNASSALSARRAEAPMPKAAAPETLPPDTDQGEFPVQTTLAHTTGLLGTGGGAAKAADAWTAALLRQMDWHRFADLCVAYYRETGKFCTVTPLAGSKGIDIRLFDALGGPVTGITRCWGWGVHRVPTSELMELKTIMVQEKIPQGAWLTNARFGSEIVRFGEASRIAALDCRSFLALLQKLPPDSRTHLLQLSTEGDWNVPTCPRCGGKMSRRKGVEADYWACTGFPACNSMMKMHFR